MDSEADDTALPPHEEQIVAAIGKELEKELDNAEKLADEVDKFVGAAAANRQREQQSSDESGEQGTKVVADPWADVDDEDEGESELDALKRAAMENRKKRRESSGYRAAIEEEIKNEKETPAVALMKVHPTLLHARSPVARLAEFPAHLFCSVDE